MCLVMKFDRNDKNMVCLYPKNTMWGRVINPLVPGWGTGSEKTKFTECLVWPYIGTWFSLGFWYRAEFWTPKSGRWKDLFKLLDFWLGTLIFIMTISTIFMDQNGSISRFAGVMGWQGWNYYLRVSKYLQKGLMTQPHMCVMTVHINSTYPMQQTWNPGTEHI